MSDLTAYIMNHHGDDALAEQVRKLEQQLEDKFSFEALKSIGITPRWFTNYDCEGHGPPFPRLTSKEVIRFIAANLADIQFMHDAQKAKLFAVIAGQKECIAAMKLEQASTEKDAIAVGRIVADQHSELKHLRTQLATAQAEIAELKYQPVAWKHVCNALCVNDLELWIARCPHCGKPAPDAIEAEGRKE